MTPIATIQAEDPENYSVMYFTFIDPDYVDMPSEARTNASLLYWIEAPRPLSSRRKYFIRGAVFEGESKHTSPIYLSVKDGAARSWSTELAIGDYMTGGFFWKGKTLNYVAQWVEPEGIKANIVTLPYPFFLSQSWELNSNGFETLLLLDAINADGSVEGRIIDGMRTDHIKGFWNDKWDGGERKLTFIRTSDTDPSQTRIYTGYMLAGEKPILAGTYEAFKGTGATAKRSVFGWLARPL